MPELFKKTNQKINKKRVKRFIGFLVIESIALICFFYIDTIFLGIFLPPEYVGYYKVAFALAIGIATLFSFSPVLLPYFTQFRKTNTNNSITKVVYYTLVLTIPSFFGFLILSNYFIRLLFGYSYLQSSIILYSVIPIIFIMPMIKIFSSLFEAKEKPQYYIKSVIMIMFLNIILNLILITQLSRISNLYGTIGAGLATTSSLFVYLISLIFITRKKLKIKPRIDFAKPVIASLIMSLVLALTLSFIKDMNLITGILEVLIGASSYLISMILIKGISREDLRLFKELIRKN